MGVLSQVHADFCLIGASGLDHSACSTTNLNESEIKKTLLERCNTRILVADLSKWKKPSTIAFTDWSNIDAWITDGNISPKDRKALEKRDVTIHLAP